MSTSNSSKAVLNGKETLMSYGLHNLALMTQRLIKAASCDRTSTNPLGYGVT